MNIEHVALNVPDPVAMAAWYTRHLGMRVVRQVMGPTQTHFLADESGRTVLELYRQTKAAIPDYASMDPFILHLAFSAPDLQKTWDQLLAAGATVAAEPATTPAGDVLAMMRDPWGIAIQLVKRATPLLS
jgi:glyoxylase I family protein